MKVAVLSLVLLGILAAICAAVLMATLTSRPDATASVSQLPAEDVAEVLLATRDLAPMTMVDAASVTTKKVPKSQVPEGALLNSVQVVGKVITDRMVANQPFTKFCFAREGHGVFLAAAVPPGKRAMSITLNDWSGMAGLLYPGSVVDVLVSFKTLGDEGPRERNDEMMSTTLLQGLQVMAIGSQSIADDEFKDKDPGALAQRGQINTRMVTLLVNPKQAEILQLAMNSGSISLAMRNPLDNGQESRRLTRAREISPDGGTPGIALSSEDPFRDSKGNQPQPAAAAAAPVASPAVKPSQANAWETTIIRGKASETRTFPLPADAQGNVAEDQIDPTDATPKAELAPEPIPVGTGA